MSLYTKTDTDISFCVCVYIYTSIHIRMYECMYVCMYVCVHAYIYMEFNNLYQSPNILRIIKSLGLTRAWHITKMGESRNDLNILSG